MTSEALDRFESAVCSATGRAVHHLKAGPKVTPPYICWYVSEDRNMYADDEIYFFLGYKIIVEVYEREDKRGLEVADKLRDLGYVVKIKDDNWIEDEKLWITILEVEISG